MTSLARKSGPIFDPMQSSGTLQVYHNAKKYSACELGHCHNLMGMTDGGVNPGYGKGKK
jgi:hypothetical protein